MRFCKKEIVDALLSTRRKNVEQLIYFLDNIGYFDAPSSGGNHLCICGGLAQHSLNVYHNAHEIGRVLLGENYDYWKNSITIASLLHDVGKCGDFGKDMYVQNILKFGKIFESKPYIRNKELSNVPHAVCSVKIITKYFDLSENEEWAILTHDGLYDFMKYEIQGHETQLSLITHWADMWASRFIECSSIEFDED